jgi:hypothetical protein
VSEEGKQRMGFYKRGTFVQAHTNQKVLSLFPLAFNVEVSYVSDLVHKPRRSLANPLVPIGKPNFRETGGHARGEVAEGGGARVVFRRRRGAAVVLYGRRLTSSVSREARGSRILRLF